MKRELHVIAHNIRSAYNVGTIFRTADGAGVKAVYLTGYTPAPFSFKKDRFMSQAHRMIEKTALGAEKEINWKKLKSITKILEELREKGFQIVALEKSEQSIDFRKFRPAFPVVLILGNEVRGVGKSILEKCDRVISIPMRGKKESLNVGTAAAVAFYEILK